MRPATGTPGHSTQSAAFNAAIAAGQVRRRRRSNATSTQHELRRQAVGRRSPSCRPATCSTRRATSTAARSYQTNPSAALFTGDIAGLGGATQADRRGPQHQLAVRRTEHPGDQEPRRATSRRATTTTATSARRPTTRPTSAGSRSSRCCCAGHYGTGFRAPTLVDLWQPQVLGTSAQFNDPAHRPDRPAGQRDHGRQPGPEAREVQAVVARLRVRSRSPSLSHRPRLLQHQGRERDLGTPSTQEIVSQARARQPGLRRLGACVTRVTNEIDRRPRRSCTTPERSMRRAGTSTSATARTSARAGSTST